MVDLNNAQAVHTLFKTNPIAGPCSPLTNFTLLKRGGVFVDEQAQRRVERVQVGYVHIEGVPGSHLKRLIAE